VWLHRNMSELF